MFMDEGNNASRGLADSFVHSDGYVKEVPNLIWDCHKYIMYSKPNLVHDQVLQYGSSKDLDDFCLKGFKLQHVEWTNSFHFRELDFHRKIVLAWKQTKWFNSSRALQYVNLFMINVGYVILVGQALKEPKGHFLTTRWSLFKTCRWRFWLVG
ncbi:hypothetical protein POM88_006563 [Heracleum sosnowskyi]|uniref:Uncharacterized protein n=1 Tax=Heracleum sosnowskyi TaxID=360622 RepID=A0AAD8J6I8_9APIA|nr:hypothetical protein POM88_006563 [Heracleum sosnowskyi]